MTALNFEKFGGLIPAVIQHARTRQVLMVGFMNQEAFERTKDSGRVTFYSRSRNTLWTKGETSGHFLLVEGILIDCDQDTVLIQAEPQGPTCHTGSDTCFGESVHEGPLFLQRLASIIRSRKETLESESYTSRLFTEGLDRIAQKVGEEAVEVVIAAKNHSDEGLLNEASDLLFHLLVLLEQREISLEKVIETLMDRSRSTSRCAKSMAG